MSKIKLWPHGTIVAAVFALIAGVGVWFYAKHEPAVEAETLPNAARIQRVEGEVAFCDDRANTDANAQWTAATANQPFSEGDRIYTRASRAPRWLLADATSPGSIQTPRLTWCALETAALRSQCATARPCLTSGTCNQMNCLK